MSFIKRKLNYLFSSDTITGAQNVNDDGNQFSVQLDRPIHIPHGVEYATLEITSARIWNTVPNISAEIGNNKLYINTTHLGLGALVITIPDGLYSLEDLSATVARAFLNASWPEDMLVWSSDESTQKTIIKFTYIGTQLDMTQSDTFREVIGFDSRLVPLLVTTVVDYNETADNTASFNRTNAFQIRGDIISAGIPSNSQDSNILAEIPITAAPGSLIVYEPIRATQIDASDLIGYSKGNFNFRLTDQRGRQIDTRGEIWSFLVVITYWLHHSLNKSKTMSQ